MRSSSPARRQAPRGATRRTLRAGLAPRPLPPDLRRFVVILLIRGSTRDKSRAKQHARVARMKHVGAQPAPATAPSVYPRGGKATPTRKQAPARWQADITPSPKKKTKKAQRTKGSPAKEQRRIFFGTLPEGWESATSQSTGDVFFVCDLEVPWDFEPTPIDGEVESFQRMSVDELLNVLARGEPTPFKPNINLVMIDFLKF